MYTHSWEFYIFYVHFTFICGICKRLFHLPLQFSWLGIQVSLVLVIQLVCYVYGLAKYLVCVLGCLSLYAHAFTCLVNKSSSMHSLCIIVVLKSEFHTAIYKQSLAQYVLCLKNILLLHHRGRDSMSKLGGGARRS